jgi:hypothetical protein
MIAVVLTAVIVALALYGFDARADRARLRGGRAEIDSAVLARAIALRAGRRRS